MTKTWKKVVSTLKHLVFNHEMGSLLKFTRSKIQKSRQQEEAPHHWVPFSSGKYEKTPPPYCNEKTECFLLKLKFETSTEWCGACTRSLFLCNFLKILLRDISNIS